MTSPTLHFDVIKRDNCHLPPKGCFAPIVVTAPKLPNINQLDSAIGNYTTNEFFSNTENYEELFPGFYGDALQDLQDSITTLVRIENGPDTAWYYIVYSCDQDSLPDYSNVY